MIVRSHLRWVFVTLLLAVAVGLLAGRIAGHRALATLAAATRTDAQLRVALLDSELARFRLLPLALADDRDVVTALSAASGADKALNRKLEVLARATGAAVIYVIASDGRAIAASNWRSPQSFVGTDYGFRRYFLDAQANGAASQFALGTRSGRPGLYLARRAGAGGVIVVKLEFDKVEAEWARAGGITYVHDAPGVVVVTSLPAWRFAASAPLSAQAVARFRAEASMPPGSLARLPVERNPDDVRVMVGAAPFVAADARTSQPGWVLTLLRPAGPVANPAERGAGIGAALAAIAFGALGWGWRQRAALIRQRTAELERAVAERTADLRREMDERAASEARAAELREGLRQANRLASLGQITASVAHETAQPVAAILTYAHTSETLLDRGDVEAVRANLGTIRRLADRIGTVTAELRGFSRRQSGEVRPVSLAEVVDGALLILKEQLRAVTLDRPAIDPALLVRGGKVRLEQVLVNLIQNAIEALSGRADGRVRLAIDADDTTVRLTVTDNGPGIAPDIGERLFTPFVTSRANGLGLGLVIAQDIMADMSGGLRLLPSDQGARFEMELSRA
jgi:two-component system C4-dicarboxylate transport sensor histidine kinase DctB